MSLGSADVKAQRRGADARNVAGREPLVPPTSGAATQGRVTMSAPALFVKVLPVR